MKAGAAAKRLGVTVKTMQHREREERLMPMARSRSNQRLYTEPQLAAFIGIHTDGVPTRLVAYCRVSSAARKPDLQNQRRVLEEFVVVSIRLYGLRNYRKKLNEALK